LGALGNALLSETTSQYQKSLHPERRLPARCREKEPGVLVPEERPPAVVLAEVLARADEGWASAVPYFSAPPTVWCENGDCTLVLQYRNVRVLPSTEWETSCMMRTHHPALFLPLSGGIWYFNHPMSCGAISLLPLRETGGLPEDGGDCDAWRAIESRLAQFFLANRSWLRGEPIRDPSPWLRSFFAVPVEAVLDAWEAAPVPEGPGGIGVRWADGSGKVATWTWTVAEDGRLQGGDAEQAGFRRRLSGTLERVDRTWSFALDVAGCGVGSRTELGLPPLPPMRAELKADDRDGHVGLKECPNNGPGCWEIILRWLPPTPGT
jgi:hypothetical protein